MKTTPKRAVSPQLRSIHAPASLGEASLVIPFYRNGLMLRKQMLDAWAGDGYKGWQIIVVDDGSPEPALDVFRGLEDGAQARLRDRLRILRIGVDIPWNRGGARNLGAYVADTDWLVHIDIDHILPDDSAARLLEAKVDPKHWYRFPRWRVGKADDTRKKDAIPDDCTFGKIHPHVDSYLITREMYWKTGGYNEAFSGCLGGGGAFLKRLERMAGPPELFPDDIRLHVYTRSVVPDASDCHLSRNPAEFAKRKREVGELSKPIPPINFPWERVL